MEGALTETNIECAEVVGKTVVRLKLIRSESGGQEVLLEFTDGTAFSLTVEPMTTRTASLIDLSQGSPMTIQRYDD